MNNSMKRSFSRKVCSLLLFACSFAVFTMESVAATPKKKEKEFEISGQVFIVKNDGNNVKLALVVVSAFPEETVEDHIRKTRPSAMQYAIPKMAALSDAKKVRDDAQAALELAKRQSSNAQRKYYDQNLSPKTIEHLDRMEELNVALPQLVADSAQSDVDKYVSHVAIALRASVFLDGLTMPTAIAKTDADGKFTLTVPPGNYVLIAKATRLTGSSTEIYEWMVKTDARKMKQNVMLSNDNLFEIDKACQECVLIKTAD